MIRAILFGEFDTNVGPKLTYQHPEGFINSEAWTVLFDYIIPNSSLCDRVVGVRALGWRIAGVPIEIRNDKYYRNLLVFNCCFVFDEDVTDRDVSRHEPALRRIADTLKALEIERELVLRKNLKSEFLTVLPLIMRGLNDKGECAVPIPNTDTVLRLSIVQDPEVPPDPVDSEVLWRMGSENEAALQDVSAAALQIYEHIDNVNTLSDAARQASVEILEARAALRELQQRGFADVQGKGLLALTYVVTPRLRELYSAEAHEREVFLAACAPVGDPAPKWEDVFALFALLRPGVTPMTNTERFARAKVDATRFLHACLERGIVTPMRDPHAAYNDARVAVPPSMDNPQYSAIKEPVAARRYFV